MFAYILVCCGDQIAEKAKPVILKQFESFYKEALIKDQARDAYIEDLKTAIGMYKDAAETALRQIAGLRKGLERLCSDISIDSNGCDCPEIARQTLKEFGGEK